MRKTPLRRESKKHAARRRACAPFRRELIRKVGRCEKCGRRWWAVDKLDPHEIARGAHRQKALDKPFAVLIVCRQCHEEFDDTHAWPYARQLALLKRSRPEDYDLTAFVKLLGDGPKRITEAEVDAWLTGPDRRMTG